MMSSEKSATANSAKEDALRHWPVADNLYASGNVRGSYSPMRFVVRLNSGLHDILKSKPSGFVSARDVDVSLFDAFSTYFHETIHWWQHIGSTTGLMLSLTYPAESHVNRDHLLALLRDIGGKKSLKTLLESNDGSLSEDVQRHLNIVLNNWHDGEFNIRIVLNSRLLTDIISSPYFDSVGHSLFMGLSHALWLLSATFDPDTTFFPDIRKWEPHFEELRAKRANGFYPGSPITRLPLGALHIFEGQARFCQLQYLHLATGGSLSWDAFRAKGMMSDTYVTAFEWFLKWSELDWPTSPIDPTVHLFLLICDLSINPSDGYPFDLYHFESLIESLDPGFRFCAFSTEVAKNKHLREALIKCSRDEYVTITSALAKTLVCEPPHECAERIVEWASTAESLKALLREEETFDFAQINLPVRLFFAKHIRFAQDRVSRPEFFCWPAMHMVSNPTAEPDLEGTMAIWNRHEPVFVADLQGEIRPVLKKGATEANIYKTFHSFYGWNVMYDIVRQWIISDEPFDFDYTWLTPQYSADEMRGWVSPIFEQAFGARLDDFECVAKAE
jgi:hypothetical protein